MSSPGLSETPQWRCVSTCWPTKWVFLMYIWLYHTHLSK